MTIQAVFKSCDAKTRMAGFGAAKLVVLQWRTSNDGRYMIAPDLYDATWIAQHRHVDHDS